MAEVSALQTDADIKRWENSLHGRNRLLVTLGVSFGLRISDLLTIRVGDIRGKKVFKIAEQKTGKVREITINKKVAIAAKALKGADSDYVFASRKGANKPISTTQAYRILLAGAERAGFVELDEKGRIIKGEPIGTHTLRKSFGRKLYRSGYSLPEIMNILGHSSEAMTLRYIGITKENVATAYKAIDW
ncbi:tyrosine-type recombinase/integrase [Shouchella clausii]|uniref:tyrosine-type recombinase/integrase n=1 Tax=Shouchella clausii TaxID=79880 RepID=UPI000BA72835|nr:tyrosine-type recombinase/integrase [Shouchella clausii]PAD19114.1 hypothetical protein CHH73_03360 [Shouchella clausii]